MWQACCTRHHSGGVNRFVGNTAAYTYVINVELQCLLITLLAHSVILVITKSLGQEADFVISGAPLKTGLIFFAYTAVGTVKIFEQSDKPNKATSL